MRYVRGFAALVVVVASAVVGLIARPALADHDSLPTAWEIVCAEPAAGDGSYSICSPSEYAYWGGTGDVSNVMYRIGGALTIGKRWNATGYDGHQAQSSTFRACVGAYDPTDPDPASTYVYGVFGSRDTNSRSAGTIIGGAGDAANLDLHPWYNGDYIVWGWVGVIGAACAEANDPLWDPEDPPVFTPPAAPTIEVTGVELPGETLSISLIGEDHDGEDVTCIIQGSAANPYTGTIAAGVFVLSATYVFEDNGIYNIACEADDLVFNGTDPEVGEVRRVLRIGSGVDEVLGGCELEFDPGGLIGGLNDYEACLLAYGESACGAWYNIACHFGVVLKWAFVPDGDLVVEMIASVQESAAGNWPLGPIASSAGYVGAVLEDVGTGMVNPAEYEHPDTCEEQLADPPASEHCEFGILVGHPFSEGGVSAFGEIPLGGDLIVPEFRMLGMPSDEAGQWWAETISDLLAVGLGLGFASFLWKLAGWVMKRGTIDWDDYHQPRLGE